MEPYFYLLFFITLIAIPSFIKSHTKRGGLYFVIFSFTAIVLLQSLRKWTVGIDIVTYLSFFERVSNDGHLLRFMQEFHSLEKGFIYYMKLLSFITTNPQVYLSLVSITIFSLVGYVIYKNSKNYYLSIIAIITLVFFNFSFSGIRQSIAIAIAFISFEFIKKKKWVLFILLVLLASTFHTSALVFLIAFPLYYLRIEKKHLFLILILIAVVFLFKSFFLKFILVNVFDKYDGSTLLVSTGAYTMFFVMLALYVVSMIVKKPNSYSPQLNAYSNYLLVAVLIQIAASESQIAMRAGYYYFIFSSLLIPEIIVSTKNERIRPIIYVLVVIICFSFYYLTTSGGSLDPYLFYWQ